MIGETTAKFNSVSEGEEQSERAQRLKSNMAGRRESVVMFPYMSTSHIIPFIALALRIEQQKNCNVTLVNTPLNIQKFRSFIPPNSSIRLVELPFNSSDHGLPPGIENTDAIPYPLICRLLEASKSLKSAFKKLMEDLIREQNGHRPLCIISDIFFGWTASLAKEFNVFHAIFNVTSAFGMACSYSLWMHLPHRKVNSVEFSLPDFPEASRIHVTQLSPAILKADGTDASSVYHKENLSEWVNSGGILVNTLEQFDNIGLLYFRRELGLPAWPVGSVILSLDSRGRAVKEGGISPEACIEWLNSKATNSVLYVSFGSMNTISASQMIQLAMALEASGKNFIWVLRPPIGSDINSELKAEEWLPEGFEDRIKDSRRGLVVNNWAPQWEILSHKSVAAFLTQGGWNSVLEALSNGLPLIGWPLAFEQFFNIKLLEEKVGVCVEVARGNSCEVRHEDIVAKIELVMNETEKGKDMRIKASQVMEMINNATKDEEGFRGSSVKAMDDFFSAAMSMKERTESKENVEK